MLGQPVSMLIPQVVGFRSPAQLPEGATATDLVLTVTEMLRKKGVVGKFVEFFGPGLATPAAGRPRHHRQHGARVRRHLRLLPRRPETLDYLALHRPAGRAGRAGRGLHEGAGALPHRRHARSRSTPTPCELDLGTVEPSLAGPAPAAGPGARSRDVKPSFLKELAAMTARRQDRQGAPDGRRPASRGRHGRRPAIAEAELTAVADAAAGRAARTARWSSPPSRAAPTPPTRR